MGVAVGACVEVSKSRRAGENAFSRVLGGGGKTIDLAQSKRNWMRHNECGLWSLGGFCGAPFGAGGRFVPARKFGGFERLAGGGGIFGGGAGQGGGGVGGSSEGGCGLGVGKDTRTRSGEARKKKTRRKGARRNRAKLKTLSCSKAGV